MFFTAKIELPDCQKDFLKKHGWEERGDVWVGPCGRELSGCFAYSECFMSVALDRGWKKITERRSGENHLRMKSPLTKRIYSFNDMYTIVEDDWEELGWEEYSTLSKMLTELVGDFDGDLVRTILKRDERRLILDSTEL